MPASSVPDSLETGRAVATGGVDVDAPRLPREPVFKRPFDLVMSGMALAVMAPIWLCLAIAIVVEDGRPILFRQLRIGRGGTLFRMLKFRSMVVDPRNVERQARSDDPRITSVGRFMRRTGLDELPQLWNIFVGEMSFVGPRPQPERERVLLKGVDRDVVVRQVPGHELRTRVRPGLTGVAQIFAPRVVEHRRKFRYDAIYVRRLAWPARHGGAGSAVGSLLNDLDMLIFDVGLILRSAWIAVRGDREV
jgi:lipopolysaccharide/colanic/teichoic acid biosynthesis glycosyltransferase